MKNFRKNRKTNVVDRIQKGLLFAFLMLGLGLTGLQAQNFTYDYSVNGEATDEPNVSAGDIFTLTIGIQSDRPIDGITASFFFPADMMQEDDGVAVDLVGNALILNVLDSVNNDTGYMTLTKFNPFGSVQGDVAFCEWSFIVADDVVDGSTITITPDFVTPFYVVIVGGGGNAADLNPENTPAITITVGDVVVFDCPELEANIGDSCDDMDDTTENDMVGDDCLCAGTPISTGPVNDLCADAIAISCGDSLAGSNVGAGIDQLDFCGTSQATNSGGVWYTYSDADGGQVTASLCGSEFDTKMQIFTGSCDDLVCLTGEDDDFANGCGNDPTITFNAEGGTDYYILVYGFSANEGSFGLELECSAFDCPEQGGNIGDACDDGDPGTAGTVLDEDCNCGGGVPVAANDEACTASALACGDTISQSMIGSTPSLDDACAGSGAADVWFSFSTDGSQLVTVGEVTGFDAVVQLFIGDDCDNLVEAGACKDGPENYSISEAGNYYFRVRPYFTSGESATISVALTCVDYDCPDQTNFGDACDDGDPSTIGDVINEVCECAGTPLATNDNCDDAIAVECGTEYLGSTVNSTATEGQAYCGTGAPSSTNGGIWYSYTGTEAATVTLDLSGSSFDTKIFVYTGECDALECLTGDDDGGEGNTSLIEFAADANVTYSIYVSGFSSTRGDVVLNVSCLIGFECPDLEANIGDACDDLDPTTFDDVVGDDCLCAGTPFDCPELLANIGDDCDDLDPSTLGDVVTADCLCAGTPIPANDGCAGAIALTCNDTIVGNTANSSASGIDTECNGFSSTDARDLFYSFEADGTSDYLVSLNQPSGSFGLDGVIFVYSGVCEDLTNLGCDDSGNPEEVELIAPAAGTYIVRIFDYSGTAAFTLSLTCTENVVFDCPALEANIGDSCDDMDDMTENDMVGTDCLCAGTPIVVFDCPALEANIGDSCDDMDDMTENDMVGTDCLCAGTPIVVEFDCPQLEANFGDECNDGDDSTENDMINADCLCAGTPIVTPSCDDFVYYISDHAAADGISDIYEVTVSGGVATMEYIATSDIEIHIAFNSVDNLLYAVSKHTNSYRTLDPNAVAPSFGPTIALGADYGELTAAVFNADGKLLIGSQNNNAIYSVNVTTNVVSSYDTYAPVTGGDLAFDSEGYLYLATRSGNGLYQVWSADVMPDVFIGNAPTLVTGMAITDTDNLLVSAQGQSSLQLFNTAGVNVDSYPLSLDGEPYTLRDGDMASGCNTFEQPGDGECLNYKLYYIHTAASGGQEPLLEVTLNGDGTASYSTIISDIGGHIGLSPDGSIIYNVNNNLKIVDVASATVIATMNITKPNGSNLTGVPAVLVGSDGTLYVGQGNQVYTVNPATGAATPYGPNRTVQGGDLIEVEGEIWLITRNNNKFTNVLTGASFTVPVNEINGAAVLGNGNVILADGNGGSLLKEVNITTQEVVATYDIALPLFNGDLAGACIQGGGLNTQCYGAEVLDFNQGLQTNGGAVPANRSDATAALGEPDRSNAAGGFVSLGVNGSITIGFGGVIYDEPGNDIKIWETSFSGDACGGSDDEQADVEVTQDGVTFVSLGSICRDGEVDIAGSGLDYVSAIRITNSASTGSLDGYDLDGVEAINGCMDEPLVEDGDCYATEVVEYIEGTSSNGGAIAANRSNPAEALGAPERSNTSGDLVFVSLGYGGSLTLAFDGAIPNGPGDDIEIIETTWGNNSCATYAEYADVSVSVDGINFDFVKTVCRADGFVDISDFDPALAYVNFVRVTNNDVMSQTPDAFDVDGVVALHNCEDGELRPTSSLATNSELTSFPNPTSGPSQVVFVTAVTGKTLVEVYDMSGRNVATLFNADAQQGEEYRLDFDGAKLPNGVYIYKMTTNNETIIEKFMIAR